MPHRFFSRSYAESRDRFRQAAVGAGADLLEFPIHSAEVTVPLTIDVALIGGDCSQALVSSSGVHGVEGYLGAAIQLGWLERIAQRGFEGVRQVLVHAVNPYGFSQCRRVNEDNIDLNRNFLGGPEQYAGAPEGYSKLNPLLNPRTPPWAWEPFRLKAAWQIARQGMSTIKQTIAGGQYEYPQGLFFGGRGPAASAQVIQEHFCSWLGDAFQIRHIDFHSGLGRSGEYCMMLAETADSAHFDWYSATFGPEKVEAAPQPGMGRESGYRVSGIVGDWLRSHLAEREYRFAVAEFGTHPVVRVLASLRAENRAHFYASPDSPVYRRAKAELLECFCPKSDKWRDRVLLSGLQIMEQAAASFA